MKHYGDITKINGANVELVDIITGGSPCQDLSVAGKRAGLAGERSGLFMDQIRIIKEMRENDRLHSEGANDTIRPRFMVWENVAGAFSSNDGEDFRAVLEETAKIASPGVSIPRPEGGRWANAGCIMGDGYSIAWRLHDAQFWGVPQRRKRIALVADFGGESAPEILFERESMSRNLEQGEQARQETPGSVGESTSCADAYFADIYNGTVTKDVSATVTAAVGGTSTSGPKVIVGAALANTRKVYDNSERRIAGRAISFQERAGKPGGGKGILIQDEHVGALSTVNNQAVVYEAHSILFDAYQHHGYRTGDTCGTITTGNTAGALQAMAAKNINNNNTVRVCEVVRRLTPTECERLQGFPDDWTNIGEWTDSKCKRHKDIDGARYRALGNSIALPFWEWMAKRMVAVFGGKTVTMASLFDGIGGFPLAFSRCGVRPAWASEIEEFPIAVTRKHFPEEEADKEVDDEDSN